MYHIYDQTFIEHICNDIKFIVENRNRRANTHELINKRSKKYLLRNHYHKTPICFYHPALIKSIFLSCRNNTRNPTQTNYNWKHLQIAHEYDILLLFVQTKQNQQLFYISDKNILKTYQIQSSAFNNLQ